MSRLALSGFLIIFILTHADAFIEQFLQNDTAPKCCDRDELLSLNFTESSFECVPDFNRTSYVMTKTILPSNFSTELACLDDYIDDETGARNTMKMENEKWTNLKPNFFQKCCPVNFSYNILDHSCVEHKKEDGDYPSFNEEFLNDYLNDGFFYIKHGLMDCDMVIADYEFDSFDLDSIDANSGLILDALNVTTPYGSYCVDKIYNTDRYIGRVCHRDFHVCRRRKDEEDKVRCVRKCCPDGNSYIGGAACKLTPTQGLKFHNDSKVINSDAPFAVIQGHRCRKYLVVESWNYTLDEMGSLKLNVEKDKSSYSAFKQSYCFEHVDLGKSLQSRRLFLCFKTVDKNKIEFQITRIALVLSSIFLILTLLGYLLLPEMQNLHGKTLMCHCSSLLVASLILAVLQFHPSVEDIACHVLGYVVMYTFLAAFMWSNIMCFDIWWTFGSMRVQGINQKKKEWKRFLLYCLYAWSIPAIVTGAAATLQHFRASVPDAWQQFVPKLGDYNCFFEQRTNTSAFLMWFILPIAIIVTCNFVLYIKTILYCYKVKHEIEKMKDSQSSKHEKKKLLTADQERMKMAVKLFLIMGISWLFESISVWTIPVPATGAAQVVQIIFDTFNCLQGVFIFCIFILKMKFVRALRKKLGAEYLRRSSQSTSGVTVTTYVPPLNRPKV